MTKVAGSYGQRRVPTNGTSDDTKGMGLSPATGVYIATVKKNDDPQYMGRLKVHIAQFGGSDPENEAGWISVSYASPFAGSTSVFDQGNNVEKYSDTMKPYGLWVPQPDIDTQVLVAFAGGRLDLGFWFACLYNRGTQVTVPGIPALKTYDGENIPAAPKNKKDQDPDLEKYVTHKPLHDALKLQGLDKDPIRGTSSSGAMRETPSSVLGILTPGQHQFVMDDGDKDGNNRLIRLRTTSGAQILLDDVTGHVYAISKSGQSWIELSNDGQIHLYGADSINIRSGKDINLRADKNINIESGNEIRMSSYMYTTLQSGADMQLIAKNDTMITSGGNSHINSIAGHFETAGLIHMNGPKAYQAEPLSPSNLTVNQGITESICSVVPEHEPWAGHAGKINPVGPGNKQMKEDPAPEQTPRQPEPTESGAPIDENKMAQGEIVQTNEATTSDAAIEMIKEENGFSPVNTDDGEGQSIGYGSEFLEDGNFDENFISDKIIADEELVTGNQILKNALDEAGVETLDNGSMDRFKQNLEDDSRFKSAIDKFKSSMDDMSLGSLFTGNNSIPGEQTKIFAEGISPSRAEQLLKTDITHSEKSIRTMLTESGVTSIPQNVFDGLVSYHNQLGDASYAYVNNEKIDLTSLYKEGDWTRVASFIAADERNRSRRISEAALISSNVYPNTSTTSTIDSGYRTSAEMISKGNLNVQKGQPATQQQIAAIASSYFNHNGKLPPAVNSTIGINATNGNLARLFRQRNGKTPY